MPFTILGVVLVLHGLVHLLYVGQSRRIYELQPGLTWPDESWLFTRLAGERTTRLLAGAVCSLSGAAFVIAGLALLFRAGWWRPVAGAAAGLSILLFFLFWNGRLTRLDQQGAVGVIISAFILAGMLTLISP